MVVQHKYSPVLEEKLQSNLTLAHEPVEEMWLLTHEVCVCVGGLCVWVGVCANACSIAFHSS